MSWDYLTESYNSIQLNKFILNAEYYQFILIAHLCWWGVYFCLHFFLKVKHDSQIAVNDTKTRIVSIIHATIIFWMSVYDVLYNQNDKCGQTNTPYQNKLMLISMSYFLYDMINCIILDVSCNEMVFHHLFCIIGYYTGISFNNSANEMIRALVVSEISCPIMHFRMILKNYHLKTTRLYWTSDIAYMIIYLIARLGYGTSVIIFTDYCWHNLLLVKIAGTFVYVQSVLFSKRMFSILIHRIKEEYRRQEKGVQLFWFSHNKKLDEYEKSRKNKNKEKDTTDESESTDKDEEYIP